jgi:hypothetical protein
MTSTKRNFVPNENKEQRTIGTLLKKWLKGFFYDVHIENNLTDETNSVTVAQIKTASDNQHTHDNKSTLDSYTQTEENLSDAVSKRHGVNDENTSHYTKSANDTLLGNKVDKITGKGLSTEDYTTSEKNKLAGIEAGANNYSHPSTHPASIVGLGNVDNTSDANKPISTAASTALGLKADLVNGTVPSSQLPSYVDDVLEVANFAALPVTGETGKIYVTLDDNITYRWSGTAYIEISKSLALGETSATAFRGNRGKTAYDHSQATGNPHSTSKTDVGLNNVPNVDATDPANITQNTTHRFASDAEKTVWNSGSTAAVIAAELFDYIINSNLDENDTTLEIDENNLILEIDEGVK